MKYPQLVSMPSAVSNWLEEQLEALGIDSAIYTRYILSLLHADVLDVIYPEDDYLISKLKKEGNRNTLNNKRFRRSKSWRRNALIDAEQIKRSAAVECLMSAAEQSCEIESLVDQLCEKLKEVNSESESSDLIGNDDPSATNEGSANEKVSPKELAEKYYAAFPALNQKSEPSYFTSNINFVLDKWPSDKTRTNLIAAKWTTPDSPKKSKRKPNNNRPAMDNNPFRRAEINNRNKFGHKRSHCGRNLTREMADNVTNWQRHCLYGENPDANLMADIPAVVNVGEENDEAGRMNVWLANADGLNTANKAQKDYFTKRRRLFGNCFGYVPLYYNSLAPLPTEEGPKSLSLYGSDLYCDSKKLARARLDDKFITSSNIESATCVDELDHTDEEETAIKEEYYRPRRPVSVRTTPEKHDLFSDAYLSEAGGNKLNDSLLNFWDQYSPLIHRVVSSVLDSDDSADFEVAMVNKLQRQDEEFMKQNQMNAQIPHRHMSQPRHGPMRNFPELQAEPDRKSDINYWTFCQALLDAKSLSYIKINHNRACSAFCEYQRPTAFAYPEYKSNPGDNNLHYYLPDLNSPVPLTGRTSSPLPSTLEIQQKHLGSRMKSQSPEMYFEHLEVIIAREEKEMKERDLARYRDGTTFHIRSGFDEIKYQRSQSGSLYLESEFGEIKRYQEYKQYTPCDEIYGGEHMTKKMDLRNFTLKADPFSVKFCCTSQNDKACQTVDDASETDSEFSFIAKATNPRAIIGDILDELPTGALEDEESVTWMPHERLDKNEQIDYTAPGHVFNAPDEVDWSCTPKSSDVFCKHCNGRHPWPSNLSKKLEVASSERALKEIWGGTEKCGVCPWSSKPSTPLEETTSKLREESREEADRLLSDLSSLRLSNVTGLKVWHPVPFQQPIKRRHSFSCSYNGNNVLNDAWSFASLLQEDFLASLPALPARRPVRL